MDAGININKFYYKQVKCFMLFFSSNFNPRLVN